MSSVSMRARSMLLASASIVAIFSISEALAQSEPQNLPTVVVQGQKKRAVRNRTARPAPQAQPAEPAADRDQQPVTQTTAGPVQGYRALTASSATRTDTPIERLPQNITVIPRSVIDDQGATTVSEATRNASNVVPLDTRIIGNVAQNPLTIRGFGAEMWVDGYPGNLFVAGDRDGLANVERIEVLKGVNALLYGGGAGSPVGGTVNVISKLPMDKQKYEFGTKFGSYRYTDSYFDINQPLNPEKTALFRITGEYGQSNDFIDVLTPSHYNINPTLTLTNREDTTLTIQAFASQHRQQAYVGLPVEGTLFGSFRVRPDLYFGNPNIPLTTSKTNGATVTLDHQFDEVWSTNIKARWSESSFRQFSQSPVYDATGTGGTPAIPPSTFDILNSDILDRQREFSINPTVKAKFATGIADNTLLLGGDYSNVKDTGYHHADSLGNCNILFGPFCPYPNNGPATGAFVDLSQNSPVFPIYSVPTPGVNEYVPFFEFNNSYITKGVYGQMQSTLFDRVHFIGGARLASIDIKYIENTTATTYTTDKTKLLPRGGVVVDILKGFSVYASYGEGMKWTPFTQTFVQSDPETSKQYEAGVKFNANNVFTGTLAVFEIEKNNVPVATGPGISGVSRQKSRGFEADVIYQPNRNWSVLGSYGYTDAYYADAFLLGGAPVAAGNKLAMVPQNSGRFWVDYKFDPGVLSGWSVGAGIYASSGQYLNAFNLWRTDGYYTLDAKIGYEKDRFRAALFVKNLTGQEYFTPYTWFGGQVAPGAPRAIYGQISYKFD
ncbi:TonB-dependent siderophore receptor [Afipia clevelandensis]|uniref:TonB-dependent siderophore receptor n=1 Tax=Afipia clevelandensis ATCC 49720 TaxID=883079 RepID=K8PPM7_9BRAD|nr:TonB-dependent siderophore receptor [Afipia clevelandensis]EKS40288.1 TonB-dependent siderophore receptor [Afipia clevelandensis ATCC 49720]